MIKVAERKRLRWKKLLLLICCVLLALGILGGVAVLAIDGWVRSSTRDQILSPEAAAELEDIDCIIVLGCQVHSDGSLSGILEDRVKRGIQMYQAGAAPKILMSGDHGRETYDEVNAMKGHAVDAGVPGGDVFMDHAGFSTYETIYRAKEIFGAERVLIVTQEYHLYRSLYIANALGMDAWGVAADYRTYSGQTARDVREILARIKDFGMCFFKPEPTYLGEKIPISGSGDLTNDENSDFS